MGTDRDTRRELEEIFSLTRKLADANSVRWKVETTRGDVDQVQEQPPCQKFTDPWTRVISPPHGETGIADC